MTGDRKPSTDFPHAVNFHSARMTVDKSNISHMDYSVVNNVDESDKMYHHLGQLDATIKKHHPNWSIHDAFKQGKELHDAEVDFENKNPPVFKNGGIDRNWVIQKNNALDQKSKDLGHHPDLKTHADNAQKTMYW